MVRAVERRAKSEKHKRKKPVKRKDHCRTGGRLGLYDLEKIGDSEFEAREDRLSTLGGPVGCTARCTVGRQVRVKC